MLLQEFATGQVDGCLKHSPTSPGKWLPVKKVLASRTHAEEEAKKAKLADDLAAQRQALREAFSRSESSASDDFRLQMQLRETLAAEEFARNKELAQHLSFESLRVA